MTVNTNRLAAKNPPPLYWRRSRNRQPPRVRL